MKKINLGCGRFPMKGYINIDLHSNKADVNTDLLEYLIGEEEGSIDEVFADHVLEHLDFIEERSFFIQSKRVLKPGGELHIKVPDFEFACKTFLLGRENDYNWYRLDSDDHYFGSGFDLSKRWGYITTTFFGNQSNTGEVHKNAYTFEKLQSIARLINMKLTHSEYYTRKGVVCIYVVLTKRD